VISISSEVGEMRHISEVGKWIRHMIIWGVQHNVSWSLIF
jgi:hypothetical protein